MRLHRLRLENFRQHRDTDLFFRPGLTGVIGPNGAGKSTLLEAIAWAIYGAPAARGTNDTIRFLRAEGKAPVRVDLELGLAGHTFRVVRTLSDADVFLDDGPTPVATSIRGATEYLESRLGMTREEFFNTYFTGQKELQFLAQMGPAERGRFLGQVLGYERLRVAQELARARRNELRHEAAGLRTGLPDPDVLETRKVEAEEAEREARAELEAAAGELDAARSQLEELEPRWEEAQQAQEKARDLDYRLDMARRERAEAERDMARTSQELEALEEAATALAPLEEQLQPMAELVTRCEELDELRVKAERRRGLLEREKALADEVAALESKIETRAQAPELADRFRAEIGTLQGELETVDRVATEARDAWQQNRQEVETRLETYRDRTAELQQQLDQLREAGPEGTCPTCNRPLHDHYDQVMTRLEDEWETLIQDGKWLKQRQKQLAGKPEALAEAERRRAGLQGTLERKQKKLDRCEVAIRERGELEQELGAKRTLLEKVRAELGELPDEYDAEAHRAAEARLQELRRLETQAAKLQEQVGRRERLDEERSEAEARRARIIEEGEAIGEEIEALAFEQDAFDALRAEFKAAAEAVRKGELRLTEVRGMHQASVQAVEQARSALADYRDKAKQAAALELDQRHHDELDRALTEIRTELNARVRPELSHLASSFLADITDGRYNALEIDESYNVLVLDEGEEKPVISGGEEDVANLVLRLAISQMIADRAGHPLNVLILDEVFGSLDVERRDNVIQLLRRLIDRFDQVVLITHVETIRDGLDHVVRCEFDERSGASRVVEEAVQPAELVG